MPSDVLCLRPQADFQRAGITLPAMLAVNYRAIDDPQLAAHVRGARALVIPAVGPKLAGPLFEGGSVRLVQVTGAGAVLIQASRGGVVNEAALVTHLHSGRLGGAAINVYATEPPDPENPLFSLEGEAARRVLFTPHIAGVTRQSSATLFREAWAIVERVLVRGEAPLHRVY